MKKPKVYLIAAVLVVSLATLACSFCFTYRGSPPPAAIEATVVREPAETPGSEPDQPPQLEPTATETQVLASTPTEEPGFGIGSTMVNPVDGALLVYVPEGEFLMGSEASDADSDEAPEHQVWLDAFWIYQTEVTNGQYRQCVEDDACELPGDTSNYQDPDYAEHPVVYVSWFDADDYCQWAGGRLATEAEWEKAIRGTDERSYPWGNESPNCSLANFSGCIGGTSPVGSYPSGASPYGALDMAGNVWEWVADWYASDYYSQADYENPTGPETGSRRATRGGSWYVTGRGLRVSFRYWSYPDYWDFDFGFRCLRSP